MQHLSSAALTSLDARVERPSYDRSAVTTGIVHFGVGGFHRAHQAMYLDRLMNEGKALDWGICGVGTLPARRPDARRRWPSRTASTRWSSSTPTARWSPGSSGRIVALPVRPRRPRGGPGDRWPTRRTRIVSLTITEGGYHVHPVTGEFDATDPGLQADLAPGAVPGTVFGLRHRGAGAAAGTVAFPPFTVMSCDNIPGNGDVAQRMITAFARLKDADLGRLDGARGAVPELAWSTGSPRSPPTTTSSRLAEEFGVEDGWPVVCEPFTQWALEDDFSDDRPPFEDVGVQLVPDVEPYELMKLRLLNASHQALCYLGYLAGYRYAHEVCQDELFASFLLGYMDREATPTLAPVPGVDLDAYKHQLIERFANPEVRDTLARLCAESSDRIPKWLVPVVREQPGRGRRRSGTPPSSSPPGPATPRGCDEQGEPIEVVDRLRDTLVERARRQSEDPLVFVVRPRPVRGPGRRRAVRQRRTAGRWTPCTARALGRRSRRCSRGRPHDALRRRNRLPCAWRSCGRAGDIGVEQRPAPSPGRGEVLVRVRVGGCLRLRHPLLRPRPDRPVRGRVAARARARGLRRRRRGG